MRKKITGFTLAPCSLRLAFLLEAQQPTKIPRIGFVSEAACPTILGLMSRHSGKGCEISVILREKTSWLSIATRRESRTASQALWPNSCNSRSMSLSRGLLPAIRAAKQATKTIPIVMVTNSGSSRDWASR